MATGSLGLKNWAKTTLSRRIFWKKGLDKQVCTFHIAFFTISTTNALFRQNLLYIFNLLLSNMHGWLTHLLHVSFDLSFCADVVTLIEPEKARKTIFGFADKGQESDDDFDD
jgi:hypothetical protein